MSLEEKLADIRAAGAKRIPEDKRAIMGAFTQAQRDSGILNTTVKVGDTLPPFVLTNAAGADVSSDDLLGRGAVVLTVFRGHW